MNTKHTNRSSSSWPKISAAKNTLNYKHFLLTCLVISYTWLEEISSLSFSQKCKNASEHCCWCNHGFPMIQKLSPKNEWKSVSGKTKLFIILSQRKKKNEKLGLGPWWFQRRSSRGGQPCDEMIVVMRSAAAQLFEIDTFFLDFLQNGCTTVTVTAIVRQYRTHLLKKKKE